MCFRRPAVRRILEGSFSSPVQLRAIVGEDDPGQTGWLVPPLLRELAIFLRAYKAGAIPLTDVLDGDCQLLVAQNDVESTRAGAARAAVRTFRALGGGWDVRSNPSIASVK